MLKSFMAGDRADGLMTDITAGDAMAVPPKQAGPNSEPGYFQVGMVRMPGADEALGSPSLSLRHLRRRHHNLGHGAFAAQRKQALFNVAQHQFCLVSQHRGGRR